MAPELVLFNVVLSGACGCSNIYPGRPCFVISHKPPAFSGVIVGRGKAF